MGERWRLRGMLSLTNPLWGWRCRGEDRSSGKGACRGMISSPTPNIPPPPLEVPHLIENGVDRLSVGESRILPLAATLWRPRWGTGGAMLSVGVGQKRLIFSSDVILSFGSVCRPRRDGKKMCQRFE
jgi:hypothetical protein